MKKLIIRLVIVAVVLLVVAVVLGAIFLDSIVKKGVVTVGPQITKTELKLEGVSISILSGSGSLKGFVLGNPEGFKSESAINVNKVEVGVKPGSLLGDKVHVTHVRMTAPEITFEVAGMNVLANNLSKILENVQAVASGAETTAKTEPKPSGPARKLQVDEFLLSSAKVKVISSSFGGKSATVSIPDIHLTNMGTGPDGITAAELTRRVLNEIVPAVITAARNAIGDLSKGATELLKGAAQGSTGSVDKVTRSVTDLLKKPASTNK
jgi:uncharacterized protein involved in outer membrane biogenesis